MDASQDTVRVRHARDVARDRQYPAIDGQRSADGSKKVLVLHTNKNFDQQRTNWVMHQYHLGDTTKKDTSVTFWAERKKLCHAYDTFMIIIVTKPGIIIDVAGSYFYDKKS